MSGAHLSKNFFELIKNIGESRSKQEEDRIILGEMRTLKVKMKEKGVTSAKMKELCIRMIYVEMLGHEASFGYINAINLCCQKNLIQKRVGYLASCLCLHKDHDLMLLLISTIQKDLASDNFLEVSMALTVVCRLINAETTPVVLPPVLKLLGHSNPFVRKKAVGAMNRFLELSPELVESHLPKCKKMLYDKDPSVMGASLIIIENMVRSSPNAHKDLTKNLVSILKQVTEHCLSRDYNYHNVPSPWIQLKLLRILGVLGDGDRDASASIYPVLKEVMKRADIGINVGYAIVYECVRTAISIFPDKDILQDAANSISRFLKSENHNLKYLGINALASIVQIDAKHAVKHQLTVIDCLEDPDDTLRRKTLDLLYSMTNPQNVRVIMQKLMNFLNTTVDPFLRSELVSRITQIAEKYAPDNEWYIRTMNVVFERGGDLVRPEMAHNLMNLIASEDIDTTDPQNIRVLAVDTYVDLLSKKPTMPDILLRVVAWVLGEYGHLCKEDTETLMSLLCDALEHLPPAPEMKLWILTALLKLASRSKTIPAEIKKVITHYESSVHVAIQQKAYEFMELIKKIPTAKAALPVDRFGAEEKIDGDLSFLQKYVDQALAAGALAYKPRTLSTEFGRVSISGGNDKKKKSSLQFQAYPRDRDDPAEPEFKASQANVPDLSAGLYPTLETKSEPVKKRTNSKKEEDFFASSGPWGAEGFNATPKAGAKPSSTIPKDSVFAPTPPGVQPEIIKKPKTSSYSPKPDKREQLAAGIFAGLGETASNPYSTNTGISSSQRQTRSPVKQTSKPAVTSQLLFEVDDSTPSQTNTSMASSSGEATKKSTVGGFDLNALFDDDPPEDKTVTTGGFLIAEEKSVSYPRGKAGMNETLRKQLSGQPTGAESIASEGGECYISYQKVYLPAQTLLTVFVTNTSGRNFSGGFTASLKTKEGLFLRCDSSPKATLNAKQNLHYQTMSIHSLNSGETATLMVGLFCGDPSALGNNSIQVRIQPSGGQPIDLVLPVDLKDVLRPLPMNVSQYGGTWKKLPASKEVKDRVTSSAITNVSSFKDIAAACNISLVKIIKQECILSAKLVTGGQKNMIPCLLHAKVRSAGQIIFMSRSSFTPLSAAMVAMAKSACN